MLLSVRLKKVGETPNTTRYEPLDEVPPLDGYNIDSEFLNSVSFGTFGTEKLRLHLSDEPLPEGTVAIAFPPLPFIRSTKNLTRFEIQNSRGRKTPELAGVPGHAGVSSITTRWERKLSRLSDLSIPAFPPLSRLSSRKRSKLRPIPLT